jgi:hypothetical protein
MSTCGDLCGDLGQMQAYRFGVAVGHDERGALAFSRADGAEDPG